MVAEHVKNLMGLTGTGYIEFAAPVGGILHFSILDITKSPLIPLTDNPVLIKQTQRLIYSSLHRLSCSLGKDPGDKIPEGDINGTFK